MKRDFQQFGKNLSVYLKNKKRSKKRNQKKKSNQIQHFKKEKFYSEKEKRKLLRKYNSGL